MKRLIIIFCLFQIACFGQVARPVKYSGSGIGSYQDNTVQRSNRGLYATVPGAPAEVIPAEVSGALAWYDFVDPANLTKGLDDHVSVVTDKSANNHNLTQVCAGCGTPVALDTTMQPRWHADGVTSDGTNDRLSSSLITITQPATFYVVFARKAIVSYKGLLDCTDASDPSLCFQTSDNTTSLYFRSGTPILANIALSQDEFALITAVWNTTNSSFQKNDDAAVTGQSIGVLNGTRIHLFQFGNESAFSGITIKCLIIRSGADDATTQTIVKNWLYTKYSITP